MAKQKELEFNEGTLVMINRDISNTHKLYSSDRVMTEMAGDGKLYKITKVGINKMSGILSATIDGYTWDLRDLYTPDFTEEKKKRKKTFLFDIDRLDVASNNI